MHDPLAGGAGRGDPFPRVPAHAWRWLQRSRPVVVEAALRLTGTSPAPGFVDGLRERFEADPFVRDVVIATVADVAFAGRIPRGLPPGGTWDRGLTWWAATLAGTTPAEFEGRAALPRARQQALFESPTRAPTAPPARAGRASSRRSAERLALARALRDLVDTAAAGQIPVSSVQQLIAQLES